MANCIGCKLRRHGFLLLTLALCGMVISQPCDKSTYNKFSTKTAYRLLGDMDKRPISYPGCRPVQMYFIARHGTRYPGASDVQDMMLKVPKLRDAIVENAIAQKGRMCAEDVESLRKWKLDFNGSATNLLHHQGQLELMNIAGTLKSQFPALFEKSYSPSVYKFRTTKSQRTAESAQSFAAGLFNTHRGVKYDILENNELLRFYKTCSLWEKEVDDNETAHIEYYTFIQDQEMKDVINSVTQRLGMNESLSFTTISILYDMCRYDTAWSDSMTTSTSSWCKVFSDRDLQVLEYAQDLQYYWKDSYGFSLNYVQACPVLKDIITNFRDVIAQDNQQQMSDQLPKGLFHFTHSGMLMKFYARLGLFYDNEPLLSDNYQQQVNRKWKTSQITPFAGNIAFVLHNCSNDHGFDYKVATYVQHQEVILLNCTTALCPWETFVNTYESYADSCDLKKICSISSCSTLVLNCTLVIFSISIFVFKNLI